MDKKNEKEEQIPLEGMVVAHELLEQGVRLVVVTGDMEVIPKNVKIIW